MSQCQRLHTRVVSIVAVAILLLLMAAPTQAAPDPTTDPVGTPAIAPTLSLTDLGSGAQLAFYGQQGTTTLTIPVPAGMMPATLNVTTQLPVYVRSGVITVLQDERVITRLDVPAQNPDLAGPLVIPLAGVQVEDNAVTLLLRSYLMPLDGYCLDPTNPLRFSDVTVTFAGAEQAPTAVADFMPPVLRKLTIYVGATPSQVEADAVVKLAAAVAAHYGTQNPDIEVSALGVPGAAPPGGSLPFERHIVIAQGPDAGVSLVPGEDGIPALLISGPPADLVNQTRLVTSKVSEFALGSKAVAGPLKSTPQLPPNQTTIRKLGQPGVNAVALDPQVGIVLDQTRLGRSVHSVRVHLLGAYTPLPGNVGGQVIASIGGETVARWPAEADGVIDRWVDIPDRFLQRYVTLAVQVDITGDTGRCGEFQPLTLTIDGETTVESSLAKPPVTEGFQSLPQALMPTVQVGVGADVFADTTRAVQIITGLQRLSALPIDTSVVPLQQALDSTNPAILISPKGWDHPSVPLPVSAPSTVPTTIDVLDDEGSPTTLTLEPALRFGSLLTEFQNGRSLLIATSNGAPEQLDELLTWLNADQRRWSTINGVALVSVPGRAPVTVSGDAVATPSSVAPQENSSKLWWFGGGVLALAVIGAALLLLRSRRATPGG